MKHIYRNFIPFFATMLIGSSAFSQVTYVNINASGAGDGTSWTNAYTDIQAALNAATNGEIWIAEGRYTPPNVVLDTFNTFGVVREIAIYGGFAGDETSKDERVLGENITVLSGDLLDNDIDNNFTTNKEDNVFHIMTIDAPIASTVIIDGITFSGGYTREDSPNDDYTWRGGAIYTRNAVNITNCNFNNNFARSAGSIFLSSEAGNGSVIDNCVFEKNSCVTQAAGVFLSAVNDVTVSNSIFQNNVTNRGALYPIFCENFLIDNCSFLNNTSNDQLNFGGALFIWSSRGTLRDCDFENNTSGNGAALYIDGREQSTSVASNVIFDNCTFTENMANDFGGGAIRSFMASYTITDSDFSSNQSSNGGAVFSSGDGQQIVGINNTFAGNIADFGASQASYGLSDYSYTSNTYTGNTAFTSGGGLINGFGADVKIDSCDFMSNIAGFGGAIFNQNDTTNVEIYNSNFIENTVGDGNGGAINISAPVTVTIDNCKFESNSAGFGGAINGAEGDVDLIEGYVHISNSIFNLNTASTQGAGISLVDLDLEMTNTLIFANFNTGAGSGGGISTNSTANKSATFNITNTTFVDNFAVIGSGVSTFAEDETSECIVNFQNNILANEGLNYEIEAGNPTANSNGGNISTDNSLIDILTNTGDLNNIEDIMFEDSDNDNYQLFDESPAINIGIASGAPETDILGNPRVGAPDAGAYENQGPNGIDIIENIGQLAIAPNPVESKTIVSLSNDWIGNTTITVFDISGKLIDTYSLQKTSQKMDYILELNHLSPGQYILTIESNNQKIATSLIKI